LSLHEALEDRALHIHPLGAQADLAAVGKQERRVPSTAASKSASAKTMAGVLAAQLEGHRTRMPSAAFMMAAPVRVSPVKVMALTPGWRVRNSPAESGPKPCTTL
jgi:hypothetical protein